MARYGIPEIENRPGVGAEGGAYQGTTTDVSSLYAGARAEESIQRKMMERARMARMAQMASLGTMARSGVQGPVMGQNMQMAQGVSPGQSFQNPMLEALAGHQVSQAMAQAQLDEMRRIMAARQPSTLQKFGPLALALGGVVTGGLAPAAFGATSALGGASAGLGLGSGLGGLLNSY